MDIQHHQKMRHKVEGKQSEGKLKQEGKEGQQSNKQPPPLIASPQLPPLTSSPPSATSSPSHEFSFTISLHPPTATIHDKAKPSPPPSFAIDLSPADDIFFHGHLLPLALLSHLPVSPRSSTNSLDSFTLPIRELLEDQNPNNSSTTTNTGNHSYPQTKDSEIKGSRSKSKSFSLFGLSKWRKGFEVEEKEERERRKKKLKFDVSHVLKRYMSMVRPLLSFRGIRRSKSQFHRQPYSFSGNLSSRPGKQELRGRRGEFSAPASMRTSPTNSGLLVATGTLPTSTSDSTMEELQAAIQAAIAHCKNSIAMEEKNKNQMPILGSEN